MNKHTWKKYVLIPITSLLALSSVACDDADEAPEETQYRSGATSTSQISERRDTAAGFMSDGEHTLLAELFAHAGTTDGNPRTEPLLYQGSGSFRLESLLSACFWGDCTSRPGPAMPQAMKPQACSADCFFSSCSGVGTCTCRWFSASCGKLAAKTTSSAAQMEELESFLALGEAAGADGLVEAGRALQESLVAGDEIAYTEALARFEHEAEVMAFLEG